MRSRIVVAFRSAVFAFGVVAGLAPSAQAAENWKIDSSHSHIRFDIRHFFSRVQGEFRTYTSEMQFDDKNLATGRVSVEIDARSIDTNQEKRDNHLRSLDFFDADRCPLVTFKSTKIVVTGKDAFSMEGDLTMRCITRPVKFEGKFLGASDLGPMGYRAGFQARTTIDRKQWGISWNKILDNGSVMLGDDVDLLIGVEAVKQK